MEKLALINGNHQQYIIDLPKLVILGEKWNDIARERIFENTGLLFKDNWHGMETQPHSSEQITKLLLTYNFKTQYHNNATIENSILLKPDHHVGFQVDSICFDCCKENYINVNGLKQGDRLSC